MRAPPVAQPAAGAPPFSHSFLATPKRERRVAPAMASAAPRVLAGLGAAALVGLAATLVLALRAYPYTSAYLVASTLPFALLLGLVAARPQALRPVAARFTRLDLDDGGHVVALVAIVGALWYLFGYGLTNGVFALEATLREGPAAVGEVSAQDLVTGLVTNLVVLTFPVLVYVSFVEHRGPVDALRSLGLRSEDAPRGALMGVLLAIGFLVGLALLSAALAGLKVELPENERALDIASKITILGAVGIALVAGVSEEVFFRGFLQPRIGLVAQAVLFALVHLSYVNVLEVVFTLTLGLVLGAVRRRTGSLWAPIVAHFTFDLLQLLAAMFLAGQQAL